MVLLHFGRVHQRPVLVQDGLGKACGAGGKIDGAVVVVLQAHKGRGACTVHHQLIIAFRESGAGVAHEDQHAGRAQPVGYGFDAADEFRSEEHHVHVGQFRAVEDLIRRVAEVEGHRDGPAFEDAEIDGQPFQAVHHQDGHFLSPADAALQQHVGHAVGLFVEYAPGDLTAVSLAGGRLDQVVFLPGNVPVVFLLGVQFHEGDFTAVQLAVALQVIGDGHG